MKLLDVSARSHGGALSHAVLEVRCSAAERSRLFRLADVLHPEMHVLRVADAETLPARVAVGPAVRLLVAFPAASSGRLEELLRQRLLEVIPGLDIGFLQEAG